MKMNIHALTTQVQVLGFEETEEMQTLHRLIVEFRYMRRQRLRAYKILATYQLGKVATEYEHTSRLAVNLLLSSIYMEIEGLTQARRRLQIALGLVSKINNKLRQPVYPTVLSVCYRTMERLMGSN